MDNFHFHRKQKKTDSIEELKSSVIQSKKNMFQWELALSIIYKLPLGELRNIFFLNKYCLASRAKSAE